MKTVYIAGITLAILFTTSACGAKPTDNSVTNSETSTGELSQTKAQVKNLEAKDFAKVVKEENAIIIDVRTPGEISEGVIEGATVFVDYNGDDFAGEIAKLDKSKTYVVYCRSGGRSSEATNIMVNQGFQNIYNLEGGIMAWPGNVVKK